LIISGSHRPVFASPPVVAKQVVGTVFSAYWQNGNSYELSWWACPAEEFRIYKSDEGDESGFSQAAVVPKNNFSFNITVDKKTWLYVVSVDIYGRESQKSNVIWIEPLEVQTPKPAGINDSIRYVFKYDFLPKNYFKFF
jgi:fibronectin type 3 domain-containing protein